MKEEETMTEQELEDQFFEERGGMIVGEGTPLWMWIAIPFVYLFWPLIWLYHKIKK